MLPFGIGFSEIIVVLLVLIVFVGPEGIPQAVRTIAKVIRTIRSMIDEIRFSEEFDEVKREILQPLEEARRYNPKQKAEAWVKKELQEPIKNLTKAPVEEFQEAMNLEDKKTDKLDKEGTSLTITPAPIQEDQASDSSPSIETTQSQSVSVLATELSESPVSEQVHLSDHKASNDEDDDEDDEHKQTFSTQDPLERGIHSAPPAIQDANNPLTLKEQEVEGTDDRTQ